jgi:hypothetical protein
MSERFANRQINTLLIPCVSITAIIDRIGKF